MTDWFLVRLRLLLCPGPRETVLARYPEEGKKATPFADTFADAVAAAYGLE